MRTFYSTSVFTKLTAIFLLCGFLCVIDSCSTKDAQASVVEQKVIPQKVVPQKATVSYTTRKVSNGKDLRKELGDSLYMMTLKINRRGGVRKNEEFLIPSGSLNPLDYSPYPLQIDAIASIPKFVVVSRKVQAFGAYENGKLTRWGPVSTGKKATKTPEGQYYAYWKSRWHRSTVDSTWILQWSWNIDPKGGGISMHLYDMPGRPASHGCVRLMLDDAKWFFAWAEGSKTGTAGMKKMVYGTPVIIFGDYDYSKPQPWKELPTNPNVTDITETEILAFFEKSKAEVLEHTEWRKQLTSNK